MKEKKLKLVFLSDVHFGSSLKIEELENQLRKVFLEYLYKLEKDELPDAVIILGDYWHKRLSLESDAAKRGIAFATDLTKWCAKNNIVLRIIRGTLSHDYGQLENLYPLESYGNTRIIRRAEHEKLLPNFDVLWIPEEYPRDYNEYYEPFFKQDEHDLIYDAILGHGQIDVALGWKSEAEHPYGGAPTHTADYLLNHTSGVVVFGHVHKRITYKDRLHYPGSFTRWVHGEEERKGFTTLDLSYNEQNETWTPTWTFIQNPYAPLYISLDATEIVELEDDIDIVAKKIKDKAEGVKSLLIDITSLKLGEEKAAVLRAACAEIPNVRLRNIYRLSSSSALEAIEENDETDEFEWLSNPAVEGSVKLHRYLTEIKEESYTLDQVKEVLKPLPKG